VSGEVLRPPSALLRLAEYPRAFWTIGRLPFARGRLAQAPRGDGGPVLVLPGLFNSDIGTTVMRRYLIRQGHDARPWQLGRNLGLGTIGGEGERLLARLEAVAAETGRPVSLVGISLGGIMARFAAHRRPALVRQVVTVSAPFAGSPRATNIWRTFEWVTGERIDSEPVRALLAECAKPLPMPSAAIWSRSDGLVNGLICHEGERDGVRSVEVRSGHLGVQIKPEVLQAVAELLAATSAEQALTRA
jgi:triacylglycerol lipase